MADDRDILDRLARIERRLDEIAFAVGMPVEPLAREDAPPARASSDDDIRKLAKKGKTIEAIKLYRERHGVGLKEAKDAVEALKRS